MALDQTAFIDLVRRRLGLNQTDLGVLLGKPNAYSAVHAWMSGKSKLRYTDTMAMLSAAGLLQPEAEAAWRGISLVEAAEAVEQARGAAERLALAATRAADGEEPQGETKSARAG